MRIISLAAAVLFSVCSGDLCAADARVRIFNKSGYDVYGIYVSPTYRTGYGGNDLLGDTILHSGYNIRIDFNVNDAEDECVLDVMAKTKSSIGFKWKKRINVCTESEWILTD
jgi:hypothetical protein